MNTLLNIVLPIVLYGCFLFFAGRLIWKVVRFVRRHLRVMRALAEVDKITATFHRAKTLRDLQAKLERAEEALEHAAALKNK